MGSGKPRGMRAARRLRNHRREQKWHNKRYARKHSATAMKANPFAGASHAKGACRTGERAPPIGAGSYVRSELKRVVLCQLQVLCLSEWVLRPSSPTLPSESPFEFS
mmetsp:Transcript_7681/g.23242  ORF Transcript_7681/g.23242 Transcript_7681/m.23242 type:complete len:107 (+) Transcript_7681:123-443(+)